MTLRLDIATINKAFAIMGEALHRKKTMGEIAIYGGSAILFQFAWREGTQDVDAVVISDGNHGAVMDASAEAARQLNLERSWLSEAVAQYTGKPDGVPFLLIGLYPEHAPGLRVVAASPAYLLAMKLAALQRATADDRDFLDATRLAQEIGISSIAELEDFYSRFFPNDPLSDRARMRLPELESAIRMGG